MKYIRFVALLFPAFHIQTPTYIVSMLSTSNAAPSPDALLGFNATILAAIISAIIGLLGLFFGIFQFYKSRKDEREKQRVQQENDDLQRLLNKASQRQQSEDELEKRRYVELHRQIQIYNH